MEVPIQDMTPQKWQEITSKGDDPMEYLSVPENWHILLSKGIDPTGYLRHH